MAADQTDARLRELNFLAEVERGAFRWTFQSSDPRRDMVARLLHEGHFNGIGLLSWSYSGNLSREVWAAEGSGRGMNPLALKLEQERWFELNQLLGGQEVQLRLNHKGRLRMAELRDELRGNRLRDQFGILWDQRHVDHDLAVDLLGVTPASPLSVAVLDMNELKPINEEHGHPAGDAAIRAFFQAIETRIARIGNAYRMGGDEALILLPGMEPAGAEKLLGALLTAVSNELVKLDGGQVLSISSSCGLAFETKPETPPSELKKRADDENARAKKEAKKAKPAQCALAIEGGGVRTFPRR